MYTAYDIDAAAEREGMAIERMADYLDVAVPETRLKRALAHARAAAELGLPPRPKTPPYRWTASCRVHDWLNRRAPWSYMVFGPPQSKRLPSEWGEAEKRRQALRRIDRARKLLDLRFMPAGQLLAIPVASAVSGLGQRTLQRACEQGRIGRLDKSYACHRRWLITAAELRGLLEDKLNGRPVANQGRKPIAA